LISLRIVPPSLLVVTQKQPEPALAQTVANTTAAIDLRINYLWAKT
jgi:hypothetical protein